MYNIYKVYIKYCAEALSSQVSGREHGLGGKHTNIEPCFVVYPHKRSLK